MLLSTNTKRLLLVGLLLLWCASLIVVRVQRTGSFYFVFLCWNLFLALIPLLASSVLKAGKLRAKPVVEGICFGIWLLFLPNAPYILTDMLHLSARPPVPIWYDLSLLQSCAGTGLLLGYLSLIDIHLVVQRRFGAATGWGVSMGSLLLCGFGIYLGRFLRWNSWEMLTNPIGLISSIAERMLYPGVHPHPLTITVIFGGALALGYAALHIITLSIQQD